MTIYSLHIKNKVIGQYLLYDAIFKHKTKSYTYLYIYLCVLRKIKQMSVIIFGKCDDFI